MQCRVLVDIGMSIVWSALNRYTPAVASLGRDTQAWLIKATEVIIVF